MSQSSNELSQHLSTLSDAFSELGEKMLHAARQLHAPGAPPPDSLIEELSNSRKAFYALRDQARGLAETIHVPSPPAESLETLQSVATLLDQVAEAEIRRNKSDEVRHRSLSVIDRVLTLSHASSGEFPPLRDLHEQARNLRGAIADGHWSNLHSDAERLAEGDHSFANLLTLIEDRDELNDDEWATLHDSVINSFGKPLAAAAARNKLVLPADSHQHAHAGH